jgi:cobalt-zinc-cadmium efflux system protein
VGGHHEHDHEAGGRGSLAIALVLILALLAAEVVAGIVADSLALLADAGHMVTDAAALALALVAAGVAARPPGGSWTFGFRRVEILAALANGITLVLVGLWIVYEAVTRLVSPPDVRGGLVLVVASAGVAVNLAAAALLAGPSRRSLNIRGAFLHVTTDLAAFAGTALAGALILLTGWDRFDPLASLIVAALIFWSSTSLLRDSSRILLDVSPGGTSPPEVAQAMLAVPDVVEVHDLHVWTVGSDIPSLSAHVLVRPDGDCHEARRALAEMLRERFQLEHTTLQVEHARPRRRLRVELPLARR